eukprot:CAMPEP_0114236804 /NCGR_PEP_ID=MMETSP0058-20121206/7045_1 /TAXON_ID=36894 /ORGANISM="Pyramimonas parkeae, CCMP726" /LENGTH=59 /DNA_ID=CAMNT_0001348789 /DNA_START=2232 /DNA_END=2411 /DNA_ORIENTATION=-
MGTDAAKQRRGGGVTFESTFLYFTDMVFAVVSRFFQIQELKPDDFDASTHETSRRCKHR